MKGIWRLFRTPGTVLSMAEYDRRRTYKTRAIWMVMGIFIGFMLHTCIANEQARSADALVRETFKLRGIGK
jgi:hypothetical protein